MLRLPEVAEHEPAGELPLGREDPIFLELIEARRRRRVGVHDAIEEERDVEAVRPGPGERLRADDRGRKQLGTDWVTGAGIATAHGAPPTRATTGSAAAGSITISG